MTAVMCGGGAVVVVVGSGDIDGGVLCWWWWIWEELGGECEENVITVHHTHV